MSNNGDLNSEESFATVRTRCTRCRERKTKCDGSRRHCAYHPGNQTSSASPQQPGNRETPGAAQDEMSDVENGTIDDVNLVEDTTDAEAENIAHAVAFRVQYLNRHVTPHLLEAMRYLGAYRPEKPLEWLSEFCRRRSAEVEG
ncbi:hypothetical protein BDV97DRAFT_106734 [Delphinella strobiligena]|nr:hypothetical protein BDV97DRAFT_106734 [Delphinella strobiligena]